MPTEVSKLEMPLEMSRSDIHSRGINQTDLGDISDTYGEATISIGSVRMQSGIGVMIETKCC